MNNRRPVKNPANSLARHTLVLTEIKEETKKSHDLNLFLDTSVINMTHRLYLSLLRKLVSCALLKNIDGMRGVQL